MDYVVQMRRKIHEYPEIGFDLPKTLALVKDELEKFGVSYTEKYGKSSIVATINNEKSDFTIGIRADMDALPVTEKNNLPFKSKIEGQMHACGHDGHTAILLDTVRRLVEIKNEINCRVMFVFQAAEEYAPGGASLMAKDGLMDEIDCMIALHVDPLCESGKIAVLEGAINSISNGFYLNFYGKSVHVASQQKGIDAIAMAVKAYMAIEMMIAKEIAAKDCCIFNVGSFHGGKANNVICDECSMFCTLRSWSNEADKRIEERIKKIIEAVALESGGKSEFILAKRYPYVDNDVSITNKVKKIAATIVGEENVVSHQRAMGAEDFSFFAQEKPSCMFRLGVRNESKNCTASLHQDTFDLDEDALKTGSDMFVEFVKQNCNNR